MSVSIGDIFEGEHIKGSNPPNYALFIVYNKCHGNKWDALRFRDIGERPYGAPTGITEPELKELKHIGNIHNLKGDIE